MHKLIAHLPRGLCLPAFAWLLLVSGCAMNPVTGQSQLALIPESQEIAIGEQQYEPSQQAQGGLYTVDPAVSKYVSEVGQRVAKYSDRKLPYQFVVLNNSVPNAWSLPGGKIAVNTGLLFALDNEAELAAVLGHEITHAAAKHGVNAMQRDMLLSSLVQVSAIAAQGSRYAGWTNAIVGSAQLGAQLVSQKFSRDDEYQADHCGTIYMSRAGYDPQAAVTLQEKFVKLAQGNHQSWLDGLFASHPPSEARVTANEAMARQLPKGGIIGRDRYHKAMAYLDSKKAAYVDFDHANALAGQNQYRAALADVDKAIAIEPKEPHFYGLKGHILLAEKHYASATGQFDRALALDPNYYQYYLGRGLARAKLGEPLKAQADLTRSNSLLPTAVASQTLGELKLAAGDTDTAKQYFQSAMSAGGAVGQAAGKAFVKLDLADNPGKYITAQPYLTRDGTVLARVTNHSPYTMTQVTVTFQATVGVQPYNRTVTLSAIEPGKQGIVASGWQFGPTSDVKNVRTRITAAGIR